MGNGTIWDKYASEAEAAYKEGNLREAEACWFTAMKVAEFFGEQDPRFFQSMEKLAGVYSDLDRKTEAESLKRRANQIKGRISSVNLPPPPMNQNSMHP